MISYKTNQDHRVITVFCFTYEELGIAQPTVHYRTDLEIARKVLGEKLDKEVVVPTYNNTSAVIFGERIEKADGFTEEEFKSLTGRSAFWDSGDSGRYISPKDGKIHSFVPTGNISCLRSGNEITDNGLITKTFRYTDCAIEIIERFEEKPYDYKVVYITPSNNNHNPVGSFKTIEDARSMVNSFIKKEDGFNVKPSKWHSKFNFSFEFKRKGKIWKNSSDREMTETGKNEKITVMIETIEPDKWDVKYDV